jgi:integrase
MSAGKGSKSGPKNFDSYTKYALSDVEIQRCLAKCDTLEKELVIKLGVFYGFRRDDMCKLEISNIDFNNRRIRYWEEKKDKTREVPMSDEIALLITKYLATLPRNAKYLFSSRFADKTKTGSEPIGSATMYRLFQEILKDAGIAPPIGKTSRPFHALRGTCVKAWKRKGMDIAHIAEILGDEIETVQLHYGKATTNEVEEEMNRIINKSA